MVSLYSHPYVLCYSKTLMSLVCSHFSVINMTLSAEVFTTHFSSIFWSRYLMSLFLLSHHDLLCRSRLWYH